MKRPRFHSFAPFCSGSIRGERGFSLIELLVVMGLVGVLLVMGVIGFQSIGTSRGVSQAASDVVSLMEFARNEAVTRQSYVWVGLRGGTDAGMAELQMAAVSSIDGTTNGSATNLQVLSRLVRVKQVGLVPFSNLQDGTRDLLGSSAAVTEFSVNTKGLTFRAGTNQFTNSITFTPRGEAMLNGKPAVFEGFVPLIGIGLLNAQDVAKGSSANDAGVVIDGSTGMARMLRL